MRDLSSSSVSPAMLEEGRAGVVCVEAAQISKPHAAMDRHGGRVCPRAADVAERNHRRSRHGGGRVQASCSSFVTAAGRSGRQSELPDTPRPASPCLLCTLTQRAVRDPAGRPYHCDHQRRGGIDVGPQKERRIIEFDSPTGRYQRGPPASAPFRLIRATAIDRLDAPDGVMSVAITFSSFSCVFSERAMFPGAAFGLCRCLRCRRAGPAARDKRRSFAAAGNDGRAEARRRPVRSDAGGAGRRRAFGPAGRLGRRSRSPGETDDAQACRS